jgi:outer membrane autotransporter protein
VACSLPPKLRLGYDRETLAGTRELTVATASGAQFLTAGIGVSVQTGPAMSLYANYDAVLPTGNTTEQTLQAGVRVRF